MYHCPLFEVDGGGGADGAAGDGQTAAVGHAARQRGFGTPASSCGGSCDDVKQSWQLNVWGVGSCSSYTAHINLACM
jgi:hypothetical protein